jgi:hypothetical protein
MRGLVIVGVGWMLAACGPQVDIDDAGQDTEPGSAGSGEGDGTSGGDATTTPAPPCPTLGCGDGGVPPEPTSATAVTTVATSETSETSETFSVTTDQPPEPPGAACEDHFDCPTLLCLEYSDAPPDPEAYCGNAPRGGATRFTGTVRTISDLTPVPNAFVVVASALQTLTNPAGATPFAEGFSAGGGLFDITSSEAIAAQIGVVAIVDAPGSYLSGTTIAAALDDGTYLPGNDAHDIWLVGTEDLGAWSEALALELGPQPFLPLGEAGGFVGLVRTPDGTPRSDVVVVPDALDSTAIVRYPSPNGLQTSATSELGLFVIVQPALAETFLVITPDGEASPITAASANGIVLTAGVIL